MDVRVAGRPAAERVRFEGGMGAFFLAQVGRLVLTVLTLGIHRFWWKTSVRRRLWADTTVDGDPLEYSGRGIEMFLGALIVFAAVLIPLSVLSFVAQLLQGSGQLLLAGLLQLGFFVLIVWLIGFAVYRARRYMLSRTSWRGIRAGMRGNGVGYAWLSFRLTLLNIVTLGFATPYGDARRWNALWGDAMLGTMPVKADVEWRSLMKTFLPAYAGSILAFGLAFAMGWDGLVQLGAAADQGPLAVGEFDTLRPILEFYGYFAIAFLASALMMTGYRARFHQEALSATRLGDVTFGFSATTGDWLRFYLGNAAWVVLTLGIGGLLLRYRLWRFWMMHLRIHGELDPDAVRQSQLARPVQGDGLADAFDVGGI
jgi:uncharacterized membrane protein YjgN (DUF898 family)